MKSPGSPVIVVDQHEDEDEDQVHGRKLPDYGGDGDREKTENKEPRVTFCVLFVLFWVLFVDGIF